MIVNENQNGIKLDKFLFSKYQNSTLADIRKFIRKKDIKVNDKRVEYNYILKTGDEITFSNFVSKILISPHKNKIKKENVDKIHNKLIENNIIFQDENLLVINKPSGLSVQGGSGINISIDKILKNLNDENSNLKLVHRLDKETSGILLIAKNIETANTLIKMFKTRENIKKEYVLFVYNKPKNMAGTINFPLIKKYNNNVEKVYVDKENGKEAITKYEVLATSDKYNISLIKAEIMTGRTHQIRVHFKEIGCPVVGDFKYGGKQNLSLTNNINLQKKSILYGKQNTVKKNEDKINPQKKLMLHSWRTSLNLFGKKYEFVAELPDYMMELEKKIEFKSQKI